MQYIKVTFIVTSQEVTEILMAMLSAEGFNGFEETEKELFAYIEEAGFDTGELDTIAGTLNLEYTTEVIAPQNWNALWESNFEPVIVDDFCTIRAHFHDIKVATPYEIVITPKMSFGTGHHATTQLMITLMKDLDLAQRSVLDFGTGTGVLAILAEMLGAANTLAIDNDTWSVENAIENTHRNNCTHITVQEHSLENIGTDKYDIILANINRHILLQYMSSLYTKLDDKGTILMSGLLLEDKGIIMDAAIAAGFKLRKMQEKGSWIALVFDKI